MVVTIEEIEIAHLERVQFGLKNFDMVFVFKDFTRAPYHVNTIPVEFLDQVKDFLDSSDIAFSEGPLNLNWPTIMKTVTADTHAFFADGGWSFLQADSDDEDGNQSEEESAFEMSDEMDDASESEAESDFDGSNASDDEGDGELDSEEEEGEDWDELEKKAKKRDRDDARGGEEESSKKKQRQR